MGFFKKKIYADRIYTNGVVYTGDSQMPWVSAVACKDGRILAAGDYEAMDDIISDDTEVTDLEGRYLYPGFTEAHGTPVMQAFEENYFYIDPEWDLDTVMENLSYYAEDCQADTIFGYGYDEEIFVSEGEPETEEEAADLDEKITSMLDEIDDERPVVLLGISGVNMVMNKAARDIVIAAAEEADPGYISNEFVLDVLSPFDPDEIMNNIREYSARLCERGITSVFDLGAPDYFSIYFRNLLMTSDPDIMPFRQRFIGSFLLTRPLDPAYVRNCLDAGRNNCIELDEMITYDCLRVVVSNDQGIYPFAGESLEKICSAVCEKGYNIHIDALDRESAERVSRMYFQLREKGVRESSFVLASDYADDIENEADGIKVFTKTWQSDMLNKSVFTHCAKTSDAIEALTGNSAMIAGIYGGYGTIEKGKAADFTVYDTNPADEPVGRFQKGYSAMTIIGGEVVHDEEEEGMDEMCDMIMSMRL